MLNEAWNSEAYLHLDLLLMLYSFWLLNLWIQLYITDFILKTMLYLGIQ